MEGVSWLKLNFYQAKNLVLLFGPYRYKSIAEIAETENGLIYLAELRNAPYPSYEVTAAIAAYFQHPETITRCRELIDRQGKENKK